MNKMQLQNIHDAPISETPPVATAAQASAHSRTTAVAKMDKHSVDQKLVSLLKPNSAEAGHYHRLRLAVEKIPAGNGAVVVAVTSPAAGDGKSLTSINLAGALAQNPKHRVLLVELDLRQPNNTVNKYLGIKNRSGQGLVASLVTDKMDWEKAVYRMPEFNLDVLACEKKVEAPYEALSSSRMASFFSKARRHYDFIIVDTAPATLVPDCQLIEKHIDKFIIVVAAGSTERGMLGECLNLMSPDHILGLVFNSCAVGKEYTYGY